MARNVLIFDTTLRDGEQAPGNTMTPEEKLRLARQLDALGVDIIEAGFPAASDGDFRSVREIAAEIRRPVIAALARCHDRDIDLAGEALQGAARSRIHVFLSTSDIHLEHKLKMTRAEAVERARAAIRRARRFTDDIEFSAEDASRTDFDFLVEVVTMAVAEGATTINLPDTVGYALPDEYAGMFRKVMAAVPGSERVTWSAHCHDDLGLATSNTLSAIHAGARQAEVTINGIGERAGNTSLEEVVMALHTRANYLKTVTDIKTEFIHPTSRLVSMITGLLVQPNKAIVGANAFAHEAGIHQDGILKHPMTYEIMKPETIGLSTHKLVLGKHSGRHALRSHLKDLGYDLSDEELSLVFTQFKQLSDKKKHVVDEDLEAIVAEGILRTKDVFVLDYLHVTSGTTVLPMASVRLMIHGRPAQDAGYGNGPIDAAYNTIAKLTGTNSELLRFSISALTGGTDAMGEVTVRLRENGLLALGKGADPDIITASAKAYINGLNRMEYLKAHPLQEAAML